MISIEIQVARLLARYGFHPSTPDEIILEATLEALKEGLLLFSNQDIEMIDSLVLTNFPEALLSEIPIIRERAKILYEGHLGK